MKEIKKIYSFCRNNLDLNDAKLPDEYFYASLPLCIIDSVFSIGVHYNSTKNTVSKYCDYFSLQKTRKDNGRFPEIPEQENIDEFIRKIELIGIEKFSEDVLKNRQRTSTRNGILKTEATLEFSKILSEYEINYFQDVKKIYSNESFETKIRNIPGQKSGISLQYFFMLAGDENLIKPDRMIIRFLERTLNRKISNDDSQNILLETCELLKEKYPSMNPRILDNLIWRYERGRI